MSKKINWRKIVKVPAAVLVLGITVALVDGLAGIMARKAEHLSKEEFIAAEETYEKAWELLEALEQHNKDLHEAVKKDLHEAVRTEFEEIRKTDPNISKEEAWRRAASIVREQFGRMYCARRDSLITEMEEICKKLDELDEEKFANYLERKETYKDWGRGIIYGSAAAIGLRKKWVPRLQAIINRRRRRCGTPNNLLC